MTIANRIKEIKKAKNIKNTEELAKLIGKSTSYVNKLESGSKENPSSEILLALYENLNIDINWLLTGKGNMFIEDKPNFSYENICIACAEKLGYSYEKMDNIFKFVFGYKEKIPYLLFLLAENPEMIDDLIFELLQSKKQRSQ